MSFSKEERPSSVTSKCYYPLFVRMDKVTWKNWLKILYIGSTLHQEWNLNVVFKIMGY